MLPKWGKKYSKKLIGIARMEAANSAFCFFFFLIFCLHYGLLWKSVSFTITSHWSRSRDFRLQFLKSIAFKSPSIESSHLRAGLPSSRLPSGLYRVNFLQGFWFCILKYIPAISIALLWSLSAYMFIIYKVRGYTVISKNHFPYSDHKFFLISFFSKNRTIFLAFLSRASFHFHK
jgi:hypothetical protein